MSIYETKGQLLFAVNDVSLANEYLHEHDMTQFVPEDLKPLIARVRWDLDADGISYKIEVVTHTELSAANLEELRDWISGQNSDGLGEGFEQQDFATLEDKEEVTCDDCSGRGVVEDPEIEDDEERENVSNFIDCETCYGDGYYTDESHEMCSFDWKTNRNELEKVA